MANNRVKFDKTYNCHRCGKEDTRKNTVKRYCADCRKIVTKEMGARNSKIQNEKKRKITNHGDCKSKRRFKILYE